MADINSPDFWEQIYRHGRPGWDLGGPSPVFRRLLESGTYPPGRMIVLGAGRGHDARMFARAGFRVTAVDFAAEAVQYMRDRAKADTPLHVLQSDIFHLPDKIDGTFEYVLEYTCFCAIDPGRRDEYADVITHLSAPGSILVALLFPVWERRGGPPFAVSPEEFIDRFTARGFQLDHRETPDDSPPQRQGIEELVILRYRTKATRRPTRSRKEEY